MRALASAVTWASLLLAGSVGTTALPGCGASSADGPAAPPTTAPPESIPPRRFAATSTSPSRRARPRSPRCSGASRSWSASTHDKRFADELVCYPDSGHFSTGLPGVPTAQQTAVAHPLTGELLALGGTPRGIARAQRDAFGRVDRFLAASLK